MVKIQTAVAKGHSQGMNICVKWVAGQDFQRSALGLYLQLSTRTQSCDITYIFCFIHFAPQTYERPWRCMLQESREVVYSLFENYEKKKRSQSRRDHMDRVQLCVNGLQTLLSSEEEGGLISLLLHEVHCDEVQDLVQLQASQLSYCAEYYVYE